jgi:hypothetical protein
MPNEMPNVNGAFLIFCDINMAFISSRPKKQEKCGKIDPQIKLNLTVGLFEVLRLGYTVHVDFVPGHLVPEYFVHQYYKTAVLSQGCFVPYYNFVHSLLFSQNLSAIINIAIK